MTRARQEEPAETVAVTLHVPADAFRRVEAPPDFVSQKTSLAVFGLPPRAFLADLRSPACPVKVTHVGKLRLVEREAFAAWLRARGERREARGDDLADLERELDLQRKR